MNRQEKLLTGERRGVGDGRVEGSSAVGDGVQAAISLMPDANDTGFVSFLDSILSSPLKKLSSDV